MADHDLLRKLLTRIANYYPKKCMRMLRFLTQAVYVSYEQLGDCVSVTEIYDKIVESGHLSDTASAVALLRYMLCITGYHRENDLRELDVHCAEEFSLSSRLPRLPFYERLLVLSSKLLKDGRFERFKSAIDEDKLNKSKQDLSSPMDLFQSMIYKGTLDPDNYSTLKNEVVPLLEQCAVTEVQLLGMF